MKLLRRNKFTVICIAICTIVFMLGIVLFKLLFPDAGTPVYGNRLDDIQNINISEDTLNKYKKSMEDEELKELKAHVTGKIVNVTITTKETIKISDAKSIADKYVSLFSDEERQHYDFNVFLVNEVEDAEGYPAIGVRSKGSETTIYNKEKVKIDEE